MSDQTVIHPPSDTGILIAVGGAEDGLIDQHFGQAEEFLVYVLEPGGARLIERWCIAVHSRGGEDRRATIVRMLGGCRALLVAKVGEAPRKLLADAGIEATDRFAGRSVEAALAELAMTA
ncbi:nitrogen fixation protein NifB [Azospirillum baldaniorum]|uniref:NifB/NifX family molybdenum-iron cluster-binding protein n=1 Tax=Azospirillum baldaniorum TaxID=1064539 RepID=UPI0011A54D56|nr:NifB/NifX family molybdenum-iron cluster-binding protein [Azospirillum baldaniorum]TWA56458.1 nitrogen fixation protein NifB [Azospirillum baldaniorum]